MRPKAIWLLVLAPCFLDCASSYDRTYDKELGQLRNQELSDQRTRNVADFLSQQGNPYDHIDPAGFSSHFPEESNESAHARSRNRRVEVRVR